MEPLTSQERDGQERAEREEQEWDERNRRLYRVNMAWFPAILTMFCFVAMIHFLFTEGVCSWQPVGGPFLLESGWYTGDRTFFQTAQGV
jgi:hypothetical protein